jgi:hypothetical protein
MFTEDFYNAHIPFCSDCIYIEFQDNSFSYFEEIPEKPTNIRFYYPIYMNDTIFDRQVSIEMDNSLNITLSNPKLGEIVNYEFSLDFDSAYAIADSLGYIDESELKYQPYLRYIDGDYYWIFPKVTNYKSSHHIGTGKGVYYMINVRTQSVKTEDFDILIQGN